jgi:hypothetical protein
LSSEQLIISKLLNRIKQSLYKLSRPKCDITWSSSRVTVITLVSFLEGFEMLVPAVGTRTRTFSYVAEDEDRDQDLDGDDDGEGTGVRGLGHLNRGQYRGLPI